MNAVEATGTADEALFAVIVSFVVGTNDFAAFSEMILENARLTIANEDGCLRFDVLTSSQSQSQSQSRVVLYELYRSEAEFEAHLRMPHFVEFDAACKGIVTDKAVERFRCVVP